jgi:hypothetical protein
MANSVIEVGLDMGFGLESFQANASARRKGSAKRLLRGIPGTPRTIMASHSFAQRHGAFLGKFFGPALVRCGDCVKKDGGDNFLGDWRRQEVIRSTGALDPVIGCLQLSVETLGQFAGQIQPSVGVWCDE